MLETTNDDVTRNRLATDLAETRRQEVLVPLLRLIAREDLVNRRGTLVYALSNLDCSGHVPFLAELVTNGNFEVANEASCILDEMESPASGDVARAVEILGQALATSPADDWRRDLLEDLLERYGAAPIKPAGG